jgi:hypothetical protein
MPLPSCSRVWMMEEEDGVCGSHRGSTPELQKCSSHAAHYANDQGSMRLWRSTVMYRSRLAGDPCYCGAFTQPQQCGKHGIAAVVWVAHSIILRSSGCSAVANAGAGSSALWTAGCQSLVWLLACLPARTQASGACVPLWPLVGTLQPESAASHG